MLAHFLLRVTATGAFASALLGLAAYIRDRRIGETWRSAVTLPFAVGMVILSVGCAIMAHEIGIRRSPWFLYGDGIALCGCMFLGLAGIGMARSTRR